MPERVHSSNNEHVTGDERLRLAVKDAISRSEPIRAWALDTIEVEVKGSCAILRGLVASQAQKYLAAERARSVFGIDMVQNDLVTYEEIERRIGVALAANEETRHLRISVKVTAGVANLYGAVASNAQRETAGQVAAAASGGLEVRNSLNVVPSGEDVQLLWQQSVEGRRLVDQMKAMRAAEKAREAALTSSGALESTTPVGEPA